MHPLRSVSLLALATTALSASAQNLVNNGDFENNGLSGWTLTGAQYGSFFDVVHDSWSPGRPTIVYFGAFAGMDDAISQSIATNAGTTYTVSFALAADISGPNESFVASFGGESLRFNVIPADYTTYTFTATATSSATTLTFQGRNADDYYRLDVVSVVANAAPAVPGPLAALPFALIALNRRRRRA